MSDQDTFVNGIEILATDLATSTLASLYSYGGISIFTTQPATDIDNAGGLLVMGGSVLKKNVIVGGNINILDTIESISTNTGSVIISGGLGVNKTAHINKIISNEGTIGNLVSTNLSSGTVSATSSTIGSGLFTNLTVSTTATLPNAVFTNISTRNLVGNSSILNNGLITNISSSNLYSSFGNFESVKVGGNLMVTGTLIAVNITTLNIINNNISTGSLYSSVGITSNLLLVTDLISAGNFTSTTSTLPNIVSTNISTGTVSATNGTISNLALTNETVTNLITTNITSSDVITTNASIGNSTINNLLVSNLIASNATVNNIYVMNITTGNIKVTGTTSVLNPVNTSDATTKEYVDNILAYKTVSVGTTTTSTSTSGELILNMSLVTDIPGAYGIHFNSMYSIPDAYKTTGFSTSTATSDLNLIYNHIIALPPTQTHGKKFGGGETIFPGIYNCVGAVTIAGNLKLDGQGNSNSVFIIRGTATFDTGTSVTVIMSNGTQARNVYWIAQDAIGLGASTTISGLFLSNNGAVAVGAGCNLSGGARLFAKSGAIAFGPGPLLRPIGTSTINLRSLENFIIFSGSGAIANTGTSTFTGDIGTNLGAITGFETSTVNGIIYQAGSTTTVTQVYHKIDFGLYVNDVLIPYSSRTKNYMSSDISLQGVATLIVGDTVQVKTKIDNQISDNGGVINISNRILTINKIK